MKNKKLNRLLIPAVLLIWLGVIFRWEGAGEARSTMAKTSADFVIAPDSLSPIPKLTLAYRDPFLELPFYVKVKRTKANYSPQLIPKPRPPKQKITFKGAVETGGEWVALVEMENKLFYVEKEEKIASWTCRKIESDRLTLIQKRHQISLLTGKDTLL